MDCDDVLSLPFQFSPSKMCLQHIQNHAEVAAQSDIERIDPLQQSVASFEVEDHLSVCIHTTNMTTILALFLVSEPRSYIFKFQRIPLLV
jgi:hypothetical protein